MISVELFSGCGGLALGMSRAGFKHVAMVEWDSHAVKNIEHNKARLLEHIKSWPILHGDVRQIDFTQMGDVDVLAGGPPCQPFSIGGKHKGHHDTRDMWPEAIRAVRELRPRAFLFENVRGLLRPAFASYLRWIELSLAAPHVTLSRGQSREESLARLEERIGEASYTVRTFRVNAADFGAPQKRHRIFIVGIRRDLEVEFKPPPLTHSNDRLLWEKWVTGEYWERHKIKLTGDIQMSRDEARVVGRLKEQAIPPSGRAWVTCRDAFVGLGDMTERKDIHNHIFQPGARAYVGHTGSPLDMPAKALKAGDHGVPGGENMMAFADGGVRYFTVREAARLQGFPDAYEFIGSWSENMRQLGNAVPSVLAEAMARQLRGVLSSSKMARKQVAA